MVGGLMGDNLSHYWLEEDMQVEQANGLGKTSKNPGHEYVDVSNKPFPTIQAGRPVRDSDGSPSDNSPESSKPPYRVPLMPEIEALPSNGLTVVSTFSGAGGGCLGFRLAGFKVVWASEFIPAAQEVYRLNNPDCHLDTRDIRLVQPEDILETIRLICWLGSS